MSFGVVVMAISWFEHAMSLARGTDDLTTNAMGSVPLADMRAAHGIAEEVSGWPQSRGVFPCEPQISLWDMGQ